MVLNGVSELRDCGHLAQGVLSREGGRSSRASCGLISMGQVGREKVLVTEGDVSGGSGGGDAQELDAPADVLEGDAGPCGS